MIQTRAFAAGMALAVAVWTAAFRGRTRFWEKMTLGVGALGMLALGANPELRRLRPRPRDLASGLVSAAGLYVIFQAGDRFARLVMPAGATEIESVYERRRMAPAWFIGSALTFVIAPGEELFWRGLVNAYLMQRLGRVPGSAVGAAIYGAIHLVTGNLTLSAAAGVAGAFWSTQYLVEDRVEALIISHSVWDVWILLLQPTTQLRPGAVSADAASVNRA